MDIKKMILVRGASLGVAVASAVCVAVVLSACGQRGALYMPNDTEFKQRATLPDIVRRQIPSNTTAPAATSPASAASAATGR